METERIPYTIFMRDRAGADYQSMGPTITAAFRNLVREHKLDPRMVVASFTMTRVPSRAR